MALGAFLRPKGASMQILYDPSDAASIADQELRHLVEKTIAALGEDYLYDPDVLGNFLIVQPGDSLAIINGQLGFDILANKWTGIRFGTPGFTPSFEILEEHPSCYEMVFVLGDDGYGIELFIPKVPGIDPDLLAMCMQYAVPAAA
jgi:hypothetical protein